MAKRGRPINEQLRDEFRGEVARFVRTNFRNTLQADDIIKLENRIVSKYIPDKNLQGVPKTRPVSLRLGIKRLKEGGIYEKGFESGYYHDKAKGGLSQERFLGAIFGKRVVEDLENRVRKASIETKGYQDRSIADNIHSILRNNSAFYMSSKENKQACIDYNNNPDDKDVVENIETRYEQWKSAQLKAERDKFVV